MILNILIIFSLLVFPKPDSLDWRLEVELPDDLQLRIVPDHDLVGLPHRVVPTANEGNNICAI